MTLTDIDKNSLNRNQPTLNAGDSQSVDSVKAHATDSISYRDRVQGVPKVITRDDQIIIHDGTSNRALLGRDSSGNYVVKTVGSGLDVFTATDAQLTFNSDKSFTVLASDTVTFPPNSVLTGVPEWATSFTIAHNAGFIPAVACYAPLEVGGASLPVFPPDFPTTLTTFIPNGGLVYQLALAYMQVYYGVDDTNLYIGLNYVNDSGGTVTLEGVSVTYYVYTSNASIS